MKLPLTKDEIDHLRSFLDKDPDSEQLSLKEYVCDLYDLDTPLSLDLVFKSGSVFIDGAKVHLYDKEMDGWYVGDEITDISVIEKALRDAGAL